MKTVWKFPLQAADAQTVEMPSDAQLLTVQIQDDRPVLWAVVDTKNGLVSRMIFRCLTGESRGLDGVRYLATTQRAFGFVEHWFSSH